MMADRIALLGIPIDLGSSRRGTLMGPAALRTAGLCELLSGLDYEIEDHGELSPSADDDDGAPPANANHYQHIRRWIIPASGAAYRLAQAGGVPIFMGGDHTLSMGSINGVARHWHEQGRPLYVLWFDAHADYNTPHTTITGNMHGMSAAFLCGEPGLDRLLGGEPREIIPTERLYLFGARSVDKLEGRLLHHREIAIVDMRRIDEFGVAVPIREFIARVKANNGVIHLSFDIDVLDPAVAPGVGTTVPGGATYREAHLVMELLHESGLVRSLDVVELNPFLDERGRTARTAVELIGSLFGMQITDRRTPTNAIASK